MTGGDHARRTLTFHPETGEYTTHLEGESVVVAIVDSLAILLDVDSTEIEPVARSVDPDCLETLAAELAAENVDLDGRVSFEHVGYRIDLDGDGVIHVRPLESG